MNQNWSLGELRHLAKRDGPRIVAECGLCHDGQLDRAEKMIEAAADAGCHGVKFQKRSAARWFSDATMRPPARSSFGLTEGLHRRALEFSAAEHLHLRSCAQRRGLGYGLSVWDVESLVEAVTLIRPDWIKMGRPLLVKDSDTARRICGLIQRWWALEREPSTIPPLHYSVRELTEGAGLAIPGDSVPYFCPGGYPDPFVSEVVAMAMGNHVPHGGGLSLHWTLPGWTAEVADEIGAIVIEHHLALHGTIHGDAEWSLSPEQFRELVGRTRVARKEAVA